MSSGSGATDEEVRRAVEEMELREYGEIRGRDETPTTESSTQSSGEATDSEVRAAVEKMEADQEEGEHEEETMFSFSDV